MHFVVAVLRFVSPRKQCHFLQTRIEFANQRTNKLRSWLFFVESSRTELRSGKFDLRLDWKFANSKLNHRKFARSDTNFASQFIECSKFINSERKQRKRNAEKAICAICCAFRKLLCELRVNSICGALCTRVNSKCFVSPRDKQRRANCRQLNARRQQKVRAPSTQICNEKRAPRSLPESSFDLRVAN